jgi:SAM-dependent methyltransferase
MNHKHTPAEAHAHPTVTESGHTTSTEEKGYLLAGQASELERLQTQSLVWEPAGRSLLAQLPNGSGRRALDLGCGALGWLRLLSDWVGVDGEVVGSEVGDELLAVAQSFVVQENLANVSLVKDDLFQSHLPPHSFDLVHARFILAPLGRAEEQMAIYRRLVKPGGWIVLEDPDAASWRLNPSTPSAERLIQLIVQAFQAAGGNFDMGRELPSLLRPLGIEPTIQAQVVALPPGHPYLRLPLHFARSLEARLVALVGTDELRALLRDVERALDAPGTWGTTFTLIQAFVEVPQ